MIWEMPLHKIKRFFFVGLLRDFHDLLCFVKLRGNIYKAVSPEYLMTKIRLLFFFLRASHGTSVLRNIF